MRRERSSPPSKPPAALPVAAWRDVLHPRAPYLIPLIALLVCRVALAYAITIHKSQGSEFPAVVIPLATQHYLLLQRNLVYTGVTRGRQLVVLVGQKKALAMAVRNTRTDQRFSGLLARLKGEAGQ